MKIDAFSVYCLFISLRNHFSQDGYDYFKYGGKIRASKDSFMTNRDRFKFAKIARLYSEDELRDFYIANLIAGKRWIGDFFEDDAEANYKAYIKRKQSFTYDFQNEIQKLFSDKDAKELFQVKNNQYPEILTSYLNNDLSLETLAVLNMYTDFASRFDEKIGKDDVIWSRIRLLIKKIAPFLEFNRDKIKTILRDSLFS